MLLSSLFCVYWVLFAACAIGFGESYPEPPRIERFVAIDNVCAWPNLTVLDDGTLIATIHNQPSHGRMAADVECWASHDGMFWKYRGTPAPHEPNTIRLNVAAGLASNGDLIVLASGRTDRQQLGAPGKTPFRDPILRCWICRSGDGGRTWQIGKEFPAACEGMTEYIPFGDISRAENGSLRVSCYAASFDREQSKTWFFSSDDDGRTWKVRSLISGQHNETAILSLGMGGWLAATRSDGLELFRSHDDGVTWKCSERLSQKKQHPGHLLRLRDGRLLLSYGNRVPGQKGVAVRIGSCDGRFWSEPWQIAYSDGDCGYPSSIERADDKIVTAYYSSSSVNHRRYHMGVAIWELPR